VKLTENEIRLLTKQAIKGNKEAYSTLLEENKTLAKRANTRLSALEKKNLDYYSYDRATGFTGSEYQKNRFTTSKKLLDADTLGVQLRELNRFMGSKSSTVTGQKQIASKRIQTFRDKGVNIPQGKETEFLRFIGSESIQEVFEFTGASEELVDLIAKQFGKHHDIKKLSSQFDKYLTGALSYEELRGEISLTNAPVKKSKENVKHEANSNTAKQRSSKQ
jgi:hypothetical protein